jgi:hypothetical protein
MIGRGCRCGGRDEREGIVTKRVGGIAGAAVVALLAACSHAAVPKASSTGPATTGAAAAAQYAPAVTSADTAPIDAQMHQLNVDLSSADAGLNSTQEGDVPR